MKEKVSVTDTGIQSSGLPRDYMEAVAEYIWNGFDAGASIININFESNEIDTIHSLSIADNGTGIDYDQLRETFGNFNDSIKRSTFQKSSSVIKGNKGRGRFSFSAFSGKALWKTISQEQSSGKLIAYEIAITRHSKDYFDPHNKREVASGTTGTTVTFTELFDVTAYSFQSEEFKTFLAREFGWFLMLNREKEYQIRINGQTLPYQQLIAISDIGTLPIKDNEGRDHYFKITFVRWSERIGDKFFFYFLNSHQQELFKDLTSFNNNAIGFNHSVYVESRYFDAFNPQDNEPSQNLFERTRQHGVFKALMHHLHELVGRRQRAFVGGEAASKLVDNYEKNGVIPALEDHSRKEELLKVIKSMYTIEPRLFQGLNKEQQRINVGMISLLLQAGKRDEIETLMNQILA